MIIHNKNRVNRLNIEKKLGKDCSGKEVLDHLFGDYNNDYQSGEDYVIYEWESCEKTPLQRFNFIWVFGLTMLLAPIRYVMYGQTGWTNKTKMGRFFIRITGHSKE